MKNSIIKDIFYGVRGNLDTMQIPKEIIENEKKSWAIYEEIKEAISAQPDLLNLYQKLEDVFLNKLSDEIDFYFAEGFKLGLSLGIECMGE